MEQMLFTGSRRRLTPEELARAVKLDPSQFAGMGPSLDMILALLLERKRKILEKYETRSVTKLARKEFTRAAKEMQPPQGVEQKQIKKRFDRAVQEEQIYDLERLWYHVDEQSDFGRGLVGLIDKLSKKYLVDQLAAKYTFTGREGMSVEQALEIKEELEKIDKLIEQIKEAMETAQIAVIDMEDLAEFTQPGDLEKLQELQKMVEEYLKEEARKQGLDLDGEGGYQLSPQAYKTFQGKLLERIFSGLQASRTGRHTGPIVGEGAVEMQQTKQYEFGDSLAHMDIPQTFTNAILRQGGKPDRLHHDDIEVHRTRNNPKCATMVIMDMSGSMRYDGQFANVKRMALAMDGLIRREYPGDYLNFLEMYSFAKVVPRGKIIDLFPKPVTIHDPWVEIKVDMSRDDVSEMLVPPHFTNIQHGLSLSRRHLASQDTPNRQIILITDGLPTAHFSGSDLYLLYPPHPLTEEATMREALLCQQENITINIFLVPSWSQSEEDIRFAHRLAETTRGRVFFTAGGDLDRFVVWDYVQQKREVL
jgi:uncharacterized protein with von Willebrand factor type A (vWA) domain